MVHQLEMSSETVERVDDKYQLMHKELNHVHFHLAMPMLPQASISLRDSNNSKSQVLRSQSVVAREKTLISQRVTCERTSLLS